MKAALMILITCLLVLPDWSCSKETPAGAHSFLQVKFFDDEVYDFIRDIDAEWNAVSGRATLTAEGSDLQRFYLLLNNVTDTGLYPNPSVDNIRYADGRNFDADSLLHGYIYISELDSLHIRGDFSVYFQNRYSGGGNRTVVGNFGITNQR